MKLLIIVLLAVFLFVVFFNVTTPQPIGDAYRASVTVSITGQGAVLGGYDTTLWTNQTYMQFRGIPYAMSPRGPLRFKAPVARLPWREIADARNYGRRCPVITTVAQLTDDELKQDLEDCLNLCVYTKSLTAKQPVMFYVYGGGFYNGTAADHPPRHLLEKDIVLVVPQYRVGALGWLSTLDDAMPGNAPVMDLLLALQWVHDHIAEFGGDPQNITVFGQSAGAALTGALLLSPRTPRGLIRRAIIQSGSILAEWGINKSPRDQVSRICAALGCAACETNDELSRCLNNAEVPKLLEVTAAESFAPIVGDLGGVLPQLPSLLLQSFDQQIPVMTGFTKHDGSFVLAAYYDGMKKAIGNLSELTVRQFADGILDMANDGTGLTSNVLRKLLFDADTLNGHDHKKALPAYFDLTNIQFMKSPIIALAGQLVRKRLAATYLYSFDYDGANTRFGYEFGNDHYPFNGGVHHSNDNIYLFSSHTLNANDTAMAQTMVDLWTSFACSGVPRLADGTVLPPMQFESGPYFHIDAPVTLGTDVLQELTATLDDPNNDLLDRGHIEF